MRRFVSQDVTQATVGVTQGRHYEMGLVREGPRRTLPYIIDDVSFGKPLTVSPDDFGDIPAAAL
jgi:hypothetical protein